MTISTQRITVSHLQKMKQQAEKITCLTAYDASFADTLSQAGIEVLLVGDTLGMVVAGHTTTIPVTMQDMVYHIHNVARAKPTSLILADMPFMAYHNTDIALKNAIKLMQAGGEMIKMEGGAWLTPIVQALNQQGIPVCAHLGLTPQSVHLLGGYKIQGRPPEQAKQIMNDALALQQAGAKLLVLECVPYELAQAITKEVLIPVIGIGAGPYCDGQVLVTPDMLGLTNKQFKFTHNFLLNQHDGIQGAVKEYIRRVKNAEFPTLEHSFT